MNRQVRILVLLLLAILLPKNTYGRSEFIPGYIIDLHNDTIHGLVKNEKWFANPNKIAFKLSAKRTTTYYNPTDIIGFGFLDQLYVGAIVQKEVSPFWDSELQKDPGLHLVTDTVFLQTLIGGKKPLFYFKDDNEKEHFYIREDSTYKLLIHKIYIAYEPNRKEFHNMRFIGQLSRYFWEETSMQEAIASTTYKRSSLEELFTVYLKKQNNTDAYQNQDFKIFSTFSAVAGTSVTMVQVETHYYKSAFGPSTNFTGGIALDLAMAGKLRDWSLYNDLLYSSYQLTSNISYTNLTSPVTFDFQYLRLNTMVRFRPSWFFINAGISTGYVLKGESSAFREIRNYEIGVIAGAGIKYKNVSLELRGEIGDGVSPYVNIVSETRRFLALASYSF